MTTKWTLGADAADPRRLAEFWAAALGYVPEPGYDDPDGASIVDPEDVGPAIGFLRVPEPKTVKNRFHLDLRVAGPGERDRDAGDRIRRKAADLIALGATQVRAEYYGSDELGHIVMADPEGNEFCVS